jgi:hypothetical protein
MKRALFLVLVFSLVASNRAVAEETPPDTGPGGPPPPTETTPPSSREAVTPPTTGEPAPGATAAEIPKNQEWPEKMYGIGVVGNYNIFPQALLRAFTLAAKEKNFHVHSWAAGLQFVVRWLKKADVTVRLMFQSYGLKDGNWLGSGHDWDEMDYTEFHTMNFLFMDVSGTGYTKLAKQFYLAYGGGVGLGWVMGKVYTSSSYTNGIAGSACSRSNYSDPSQCHPVGVTCSKGGCKQSDLTSQHEKEAVPPAMAALNLHLGLRYDFFRHLSMKFETGLFLPGFWYFQLALTAFF